VMDTAADGGGGESDSVPPAGGDALFTGAATAGTIAAGDSTDPGVTGQQVVAAVPAVPLTTSATADEADDEDRTAYAFTLAEPLPAEDDPVEATSAA
ncbi:MAG TPA: hypothetical protein VM165_08000, partial [Planctomycetaceae bacterium]|nr:hypothetical protein [Planctomycetaceae bacterium]